MAASPKRRLIWKPPGTSKDAASHRPRAVTVPSCPFSRLAHMSGESAVQNNYSKQTWRCHAVAALPITSPPFPSPQ
eukprot:3877502-Pyramimonas_sp.AAC.1